MTKFNSFKFFAWFSNLKTHISSDERYHNRKIPSKRFFFIFCRTVKKLAEWRNGFTSSKRGWSSQTFVFQSGESSRMSQRSVTEIWKLKQKRSSLERARVRMVEKAKPKGNWFFFTGTGPTSNLTLEKRNKVATAEYKQAKSYQYFTVLKEENISYKNTTCNVFVFASLNVCSASYQWNFIYSEWKKKSNTLQIMKIFEWKKQRIWCFSLVKRTIVNENKKNIFNCWKCLPTTKWTKASSGSRHWQIR